ncbi:hypothetical protein ACH5RR_031591 [Cinchona calisaya]|uniref:Uncharacterized protein n=1 Tax=Cinchona calisaya TaxID=153742 RepID=A0ABD2YIJ1_9GENT
MTTTIRVSGVLERLQYLFEQVDFFSQSIAEDNKSLVVGKLWELIPILKDGEGLIDARSKYNVRDENFVKQVRQLEKILYRMEDLVESHQVGGGGGGGEGVAVASRGQGRTKNSIFKKFIDRKANSNNFQADLSSLTDQIDRILTLLQDYLVFDEMPARIVDIGDMGLSRRPCVYYEENRIMRRERDEEELVFALTRTTASRIEIISICGMGGIGKTTLAKTVFNDVRVKCHFHRHAWVSVGLDFRIRDILETIFHELGLSSSEKQLNLEDLEQEIYRALKSNRWLLVLDEIWSIQAWETIRSIFEPSGGKYDGKVLVTTRNRDIALSLSAEGRIHDLGFLDDDQKWELFNRLAQLGGLELNSYQEIFARRIVRQSGGLPLAIAEVVDMLMLKSSDEWEILLQYSDVERSRTQGFEAVTIPSELVSALTEGSSTNLEVISICGMVGTDNTSLARTLYNNSKVMNHFNIRAWVNVTQEFQTRDMLVSILNQVWPSSSEELLTRMDKMELAEKVYKLLKEKRWLVVLDDTWSIEAWESIRVAFPVNNFGERILVTTQYTDVAECTSGDGHIHYLGVLNDEQSSELIKRIAQLGEAVLNSEHLQIARKIVRQSGGLLSSIILLANMLKSKPTDEWESLLGHSAAETSGTLGFQEVRSSLELSYYGLQDVLKPCLLYMGNFPEGYKIEVDKLCQLWIAEGLISPKECNINGKTMMEVAEKYFDQLAARNLVQVPKDEMSNHQNFRYGSLHEVVRDICITKAKEEEFFEVLMPGSSKDSVFRRAIFLDKLGDMDIRPYLGEDLRTLLFFDSFHQSGEQYVFPRAIPDLTNLKWIRVLHFDGVTFKGGKLPSGIGNLVLLRYLSFRDCYLTEIPSSISNFLFLLTLDLRVRKLCRVTIPNVLFKLERLKHLYLPLNIRTPNHDKLQLDGMKQLEILENFDTRVCNAGEIFMSTSLRILEVTVQGNLDDLEKIFKCIEANANHLRKTSINIKNFDCYSEERLSFIEKVFSSRVLHILRLEGRIGRLPLFETSPMFTEIYLNGSLLDEDPMQALETLPHLRVLALETEAYIGKEMCCSLSYFQELRSLKLSNLYNLEAWEVEEEAMPKLSTLTIENCRGMKMLPEGLESIDNLRKLEIRMMPKGFVSRLQKIDGEGGEDLHIINTNCTIEFGSANVL